MTYTTQNPFTFSMRSHTKPILHFLEVKAKLEESDRLAGHEYVPMNVFIDATTIKQHFQVSSILAR
jgi:hypothetical protein